MDRYPNVVLWCMGMWVAFWVLLMFAAQCDTLAAGIGLLLVSFVVTGGILYAALRFLSDLCGQGGGYGPIRDANLDEGFPVNIQ